MKVIRTRRHGMTLVEVLVALTILTLLFTGLTAGLTHLLGLHRLALARVSALSAMSIRRAALQSWLSNATVDPRTPELAFEALMRRGPDGGTRQQLRFVTATARPFTTGTTRVTIGVEHDSASGASALVVELQPLASGPPRRLVVVPEAAQLEITVKPHGTEWRNVYYSSSHLPDAVKLEIRLAPTASAASSVLALPIHVRYTDRL